LPILLADQLEKTFPAGAAAAGVTAVQSVDLAVETGDFVAITGASGSGKSTLLHMLGGITRPSAGRVLLEGTDLATLDDDALAEIRRRRIGFVFQRYNLLPELSLAENVALPLVLDGTPDARCRDAAREALEAVDMGHRAEHRPDALSGGEQQRGAIARALVTDPAIVLVGSILGLHPLPLHGDYCAAKSGLRALAGTLRLELAAEGIDVLLATLGPVESEFWTALVDGERPAWSRGRGMPPDRVAAAILAGLERRRREIVPGWQAKGYAFLARFLPGLIDRWARRHWRGDAIGSNRLEKAGHEG